MSRKSNRKRKIKAASRAAKKRASKQRPMPEAPKGTERKESVMKRPWFWIVVAVVIVAMGVSIWFFALRPAQREKGKPMSWANPPSMQIDPGKEYHATIVTEKGDIRLELFADKTPKTVNNFVFLAREGFYDDCTFHRVLPGFMAQTGDPTGTGGGGPGYTFEDEFHPDLHHDSGGILSMANRGPNTNGSQFFIIYAPTPHLDGLHTIFGKVVEGMEVLNSLSPRDPSKNPDTPGDLIKTIVIEER